MSRKSSVLVVDDEPNGFTVIRALLKPEGYDLFYVDSGYEALSQLEAINPDVILLDVMMPDMDGIEVCRTIKSSPIWVHIPIIMVTALSAKEDLARCLQTGADDFISKPVSGVELRARVRSMLRLKQQYDAVKATMQMREDMSAMIVHDLRNPVSTILLGSQLILMQDTLEDKEKERIQIIHTAGQKLNSMINDLLMMAKMDSDKLRLNQTQVDLNALITDVVSGFKEITDSKNISIKTDLPKTGQWIFADANLLYRLLDNLLSNAVKFSPAYSKIMIRVSRSVLADQPNAELTVLQVADEGPGVKAELRQQIFNKYEIGEAATNVTQIGLGLTFCKMVAEAHGGRIYVEENVPSGSIFTVEI